MPGPNPYDQFDAAPSGSPGAVVVGIPRPEAA
jgi:hypothetical protein